MKKEDWNSYRVVFKGWTMENYINGTLTASNRFGLGARVRIQTADGAQTREINNVASYQSAHDIRLHVGLGRSKSVTRIDVDWPSGATQTLRDVAVNQVLVIKEP